MAFDLVERGGPSGGLGAVLEGDGLARLEHLDVLVKVRLLGLRGLRVVLNFGGLQPQPALVGWLHRSFDREGNLRQVLHALQSECEIGLRDSVVVDGRERRLGHLAVDRELGGLDQLHLLLGLLGLLMRGGGPVGGRSFGFVELIGSLEKDFGDRQLELELPVRLAVVGGGRGKVLLAGLGGDAGGPQRDFGAVGLDHAVEVAPQVAVLQG